MHIHNWTWVIDHRFKDLVSIEYCSECKEVRPSSRETSNSVYLYEAPQYIRDLFDPHSNLIKYNS